MPRQIKRLTALKVNAITRKGMHADGAGLFLQVSASGSKSWIYRYKANGKTHDMGLGPVRSVSLSEARVHAAEAERQRNQGRDPILLRKAARQSLGQTRQNVMTFDAAAAAYVAAHEPAWKNEKHRNQWRSTLEKHVGPVLGDKPIADIVTDDVLAVLRPIWTKTPETASRVRGRIEVILDWAKARGFRNGDNPARWRGHLQSLLPPKSKIRAVVHHPALPFAEIAAFMTSLRKNGSISARALEFLILTTARTSEVLNATWDEISFEEETWTIPAPRMKSGREHRVPLGKRAMAIVTELHALRRSRYLFPGHRPGKALSNMALLMLLREFGVEGITVHGFRSTFRDWAAEQTDFPREVAEAALAHVVADRVEAAYRRSDLFAKRRALMTAWDTYCDGTTAKIRRRRSTRRKAPT